jgi:sulfur carrier protein ThiS
MKILFVNNDGGGFADYIDIPHGTSVQELFDRQMGQAKPDNYLIRVNRQPVPRAQVLTEGDRVTFTPTKIEGAGC